MGLIRFIKAKVLHVNNALDNFTSLEEKLNLAKNDLEKAKENVRQDAIRVHEAYKQIKAQYTVNQEEIKSCKEQINNAMTVGNEDLAKRLFIHLEGLQSAEKIYTKSYADITKRQNDVDKYCTTLDSKIETTKARIESLAYVHEAQEKTQMFGNVTVVGIDKYVKDIEKFIQSEEWKNEATAEVDALFKSPMEEAAELTQGNDSSRWEKYKTENNLKLGEKK